MRREDAQPAPVHDSRFDPGIVPVHGVDAPEYNPEAVDAPAKKRRRRRKPVNRDNAASGDGGESGGPPDNAPGA